MCVVVEGDGGRASKPTQIKRGRQRRRRRRRVHRQYRQYRDPMRRPRRRRQSLPEASKVKRVVGEAPLEREGEKGASRHLGSIPQFFFFFAGRSRPDSAAATDRPTKRPMPTTIDAVRDKQTDSALLWAHCSTLSARM